MQCPACCAQLAPLVVQGVTLDACLEGCAGIWFDPFELKKFDEASESADELLALAPAKALALGDEQKRPCPKCPGITMMKHFSSVKREVRIDTCPQCGGQWLDHGELAKIRSEFATETERKAAAVAFVASISMPSPTPDDRPRASLMGTLLGCLRR